MGTKQEPDIPTLPTLNPGVVCFETNRSERAVGPLDSLVLNHLLLNEGDAIWVDSHGHATTHHLARLAPSPRLLERIEVARGFTPYQHYTLIERLTERTTGRTALLVVPWVDALYREGDLNRGLPERMLETVATILKSVAADHEVPVLVTRRYADDITAPFEAIASRTITYESTRFGPRFVGDEFETLVYPDGNMLQTTLAYWERILQFRYRARDRIRQEETGVA